MSRTDPVRSRHLTRRTLVLGGLNLGLAGVLAGRLYHLQVIESDRYQTLAEDNGINYQLLAPTRGRILDRFGVLLALNRETYRVVLIPEQTPSVAGTLDALGELLRVDPGERECVLREAERSTAFLPITVREDLTWTEVSRVEVHAPTLPGVMIDMGQSRFYPYGPRAAHLLGYVAAVAEGEVSDDPLLSLPGFRIGKNGVEKAYDETLRGAAGSREVEVNAYGRIIRELARREGRPGDDYVLSIDVALQEFVTARLGSESGAAVVLDVHTGDVLALASTPGFDPNAFNFGIGTEVWRELTANPRAPLINKATAGQYPPGSTFKLMVALAALEGGHISPGHSVYCPGFYQLGNGRYHCWRKGGHGRLGLIEAIAQSCDVFFYDVARRTGLEDIAAMARRFGFGAPTGIEIPGERSGLVPSNEWKLAQHGEPWQKGETLVIGIGQGYLLSTPLQLAVMAARIANGGIAVVPRLIKGVVRGGAFESVPQVAAGPLGLKPASLALVAQGMTEVVNSPRGTAYQSRIVEQGLSMAGKTGSSQVRRISKAERLAGVIKNEDLPWEQRDHAMFVAFAPVDAPRYACAVLVEHGGSGARIAAPIARDLLRQTQIRDPARRPLAPFGLGEEV